MLSFAPFSDILDSAVRGESNAARNLSAITRLIARFGFFLPENHGHGEETVEDVHLFFSRYLRLWFENGVNEYEDEERYAPSGSVSFLNIHQAKGLEYPVVIVPSLDERARWDAESDLISRVVEKVSGRKPAEPPKEMKNLIYGASTIRPSPARKRSSSSHLLKRRGTPRKNFNGSCPLFQHIMRKKRTTTTSPAALWDGMCSSRVSPSRRRSPFMKNVR